MPERNTGRLPQRFQWKRDGAWHNGWCVPHVAAGEEYWTIFAGDGHGAFDDDPWEMLGQVLGDVDGFRWIDNDYGWAHDDELFSGEISAFEKDTIHRLLTEAARFWVLANFLENKRIPDRAVFFAYADGPVSFDWGNPAGPEDGTQPLRKKRVRITLEVEDQA